MANLPSDDYWAFFQSTFLKEDNDPLHLLFRTKEGEWLSWILRALALPKSLPRPMFDGKTNDSKTISEVNKTKTLHDDILLSVLKISLFAPASGSYFQECSIESYNLKILNRTAYIIQNYKKKFILYTLTQFRVPIY